MEEQVVELISSLQQAIEGMAPTAWRAMVLAAFVKSILVVPLAVLVVGVDITIYKK